MKIYLQSRRCRNRALIVAGIMASVFVAEGRNSFPSIAEAVRSSSETLTLEYPMGNIQQQVVYKGIVKDSKGIALPGVSVRIKGAAKGTATDHNGRFSIAAAPKSTLILTFVGYQPKEVVLTTNATLSIELQDDSKALNEVVVTAFGIKRQAKSLGYAVSTVDGEELTKAGNTNFASALYGKAAGVKITTAPGGASSAVNVQIRGINSINYNQQPLYVVDGVVIRNDGQFGADGANNNNYWGDQRIRGNGVLDINPQDIESLSVLKGASATALYGSDASSGVIVITTKKGMKGKGMGVDFTYQGFADNAAFLPRYQNVYGPGYDRATNLANGASAEGWLKDNNPNSPNGRRAWYSAYANFGPKMDGQDLLWWDGVVRQYNPQPDNYKNLYDQGYTSNAAVSISKMSDDLTYRLSANRLDVKGIQPGNNLHKNTFSLNSTVRLGAKMSLDLNTSYINTENINRPYQFGQVFGSYSGFFNRSEYSDLLKTKYQTPQGYKYATVGAANREDRFLYNMSGANLLDYFWQQKKNKYTETENRLLSSATLNWNVVDHLKFRGRIGSDYTGYKSDTKQHNEVKTNENGATSSTGSYGITKGVYNILYGDVLATYDNKITDDFKFSLSAGWTGRKENYDDQNSSTTNGLVTENWFALDNSYGIQTTSQSRKYLVKNAAFGVLSLNFKDYWFVEGTARQEAASTLLSDNRNYFYPSVNTSFVFSDALKMPQFWNYGKARVSYGVVGNAPPMFVSNVGYTNSSLQTINGSVVQARPDRKYGNPNLKPEMKYEWEFGFESRFFNSRLGIDIAYYDNRIKDQILDLTTPSVVGAMSQIVNVGEIGSRGLEVALTASPINSGPIRWDTRFNMAFNRSRIIALSPDIASNELVFFTGDQNSSKLVAKTGETMGDIYIYKRATDNQGNFLIDDTGLYVMTQEYEKAGNIMPKFTGGFSNTLTFNNFSLDFMIDYRLGGQMLSPNMKYMMGAGLLENTLKGRDAEHGGLQYVDNGVTYNDGVLLDGVSQSTGQKNTKIVDAANYYLTTFTWGQGGLNKGSAVFDNSFIKMRELNLSYRFSQKIASKLGMNNLRLSLVGRNLFYLWRTSKDVDPESPLGTKWWSQGVDVGSTAATRSIGFSLSTSF